jgi:crotonobetainyl-CoA:carnitine CoA-transferase CaiB-like acyl-CoA transferase
MEQSMQNSGPLAGIRVLDLGTVIAGPFTATILGDFGAEVLKVELPGLGDPLRGLGPVKAEGGSFWFSTEGRNKKSITLDLRKQPGREILFRLVEVSDVLVENFVPGTLERWDIGPDELHARNPRLVISRASGYGQTGPYRNRPSFDRVGVAFGGLWEITGNDSGPMKPGAAVADYLTGTFGALGVILALYWRDARQGAGQVVDAALYESILRILEYAPAVYSGTGMVRERVANEGQGVPSNGFRASDGRWIGVSVTDLVTFQRLMDTIGRPEIAADPRCTTISGRVANRALIEGALGEWIAQRPGQEALATLVGARIPSGMNQTIAEIFEDPHVATRDMLVDVDDLIHGPLRIQGVSPKLSATPGSVRAPAPLVGQHNDEVYRELLQMSEEELNELREQGIV